jgi:GH24 family phage-related lysozyme (muramidase)
MSPKGRIIVAALSLSAAGFVKLALDENYTGTAVIPTKGDVPTLGFGSTTHADSRPVRMGDKTTPPQALARTLQYVQADEADLRKTLEGIELHQAEYDVYIDWRYQYGATAWRNSSILRELRAGNHAAACQALLKYRFSAGYDCSTPGNRVCAGVWARQQARHASCMAAQ